MPRCLVLRSIIIATITGFFLVSLPLRVYAHDGPPRLELSTDRVNPGAVIEVRGINLASEVPVAISLARDEYKVQLGEVVSDVHGDFVQALALPIDLIEGEYTVWAVSQGQALVGASLKIEGAAMVEEGEQRGQEEPLLAPMPTQRAGTGHPSAVPSLDTATSLPTTAAEPPIPAALLFSSALAIVILVAGLVVILRRFR